MDESMQERDSTIYSLSKFRDMLSGPNSEKLAVRGLIILIAYAAIRSLVAAAAKPFWYDELDTRIVALQPNVAAIWNALERGADTQPPSFYLVERMAFALLPYERIALRAPSILAFCSTVLCLFVLVRRRSGGMCALLCASVPVITVLFTTYAIEARPYALLAAFIALALVCYERAATAVWAALLGISLAAAEAMHYYAIFAIVPFAIAETSVTLVARRFRTGVWLALASGVVPLAVSWRMLDVLRQRYGEHFWHPPAVADTMRIYTSLFRFNGVLGFALAAALIAGLLGFTSWREIWRARSQPAAAAQIQEYALACGLVAIPFIEFTAVKFMHGGLVDRYAIPTLLGVALALGLLLPRLGSRTASLVAVFLVCALVVQEAGFWSASRHLSEEAQSLHDSLGAFGAAANYAKLPVVVSDGVEFLQLAYYAPADLSKRATTLVDVSSSLTYTGSNNIDVQLSVLRTLYPLQVHEFTPFAVENRQFMLDSDGARFDWWPSRLAHDGYSVQLVSTDFGHRIYLVDLDRGSH